MAAPYGNILSKCDRAIVAYIISQSAGTIANTFPAKRALTKSLPLTIVWSQSATEAPPGSGNYWVDCKIICKSSAQVGTDTTAEALVAASEARFSAVADALNRKDPNNAYALPDAINAAARAKSAADDLLDPKGPDVDLADFTVQGVVDKGPELDISENGDVWSDGVNLSVYCCASNVS